MIPYIGDISLQDAEVLRDFAARSKRILEFGAGASTQVFASYSIGTVESIDTEQCWIDKTQTNLANLGCGRVIFHPFDGYRLEHDYYDLIFVDGEWVLRQEFALATWPRLAIGGAMLFHDTRRDKDIINVCAVLQRYSHEIDSVVLNHRNSNTTVITKREPLPLEDYNAIEGRTLAQLGLE